MTDIIFEYKELLAQKLEIEQKLSVLPKGYISKKTIGGKQYLYLQTRNGDTVESKYIKAEEVDYINAHGTSTPLGDVAEVKAIQQVFGEHAYEMNITSSKSMTGHLLGATGAVEAIISILSMKNSVVTPTINHKEDDKDPNIDYNLNFTFNQAQEREIRYALSNNFGFGGHNACLLFKKI